MKIKTLLILLLLLLTAVKVSFGETIDEKIKGLQSKIEQAQSKQKTLSSEVLSMNAAIEKTTLQIADIARKIKELGAEIEKLSQKIDQLENTLSKLTQILINRIGALYKIHKVSYLTLLLSANGVTDFINRTKYIQAVQIHDRQVMTEVQTTKIDFSEQKTLRERKKAEQENLKKELEAQQQKLDQQKKTKQVLLVQTRSDETTYQQLLAQALAEKQAIEAALVSGVKVGPINAGDPIAQVGNTGYPACSTGAHLHFEVRKNNQWVNAFEYLKSQTVIDDQNGGGSTNLGSGSWDWPLQGDIRVTQHYGYTPYSWRYSYSGGIHTGIDMVSDTSSVIRASKGGDLYEASQNCGGSSIIKIKYIDHGEGLVTFYLHVQ